MGKRNQTKIDLNEVSETYSKVRDKYDTLGINLVQALVQFLKENDIKVLAVNYRVKDKDSFVEKIDRKKYEKPFDECEDLCGIRIICYYHSDVDKIAKIIKPEFEVLENQDKEELLEDDQFGYRSTHFIVRIKKGWLQAPNYRGLENLKAEIQVRTVLMHAWAEIQHKLAYKKDAHIPKQFKRQFSLLSAMLEGADNQFEELKDKITTYRQEVVEFAQGDSVDGEDIELNLDSLQAFLDATFPNHLRYIDFTRELVDEFLEYDIGLKEFISSYEKVKNYLPEVESEMKSNEMNLAQSSMARIIMDLANNVYFEHREKFLFKDYREIIVKWREIIQKEEAKKKSTENN
jgi:putative GTP pyrophosphokinase